MVVDPAGLKVLVKFGGSMSNRSRDNRLLHFVTNDDNDAEHQGQNGVRRFDQ